MQQTNPSDNQAGAFEQEKFDPSAATAESPRNGQTTTNEPPLFVDLDGTLLKTDMLVETFFAAVRADASAALRSVKWLLGGKAHLKKQLASRYHMEVASLPFNQELCEYLRAEADRGRRIYLATASDRGVAQAIADHVGVFTGVLASDGTRNLKGGNKLSAIGELIGEAPFDYAGNGPEDLGIWKAARKAIVVGGNRRLEEAVRDDGNLEAVFAPRKRVFASLLRAIRPQQWLKNLLVFVPLLTSFSFTDIHKCLHALAAFMAFSMVASATYIINDLLDLTSDRLHPRKRRRPFAAGDVPLTHGVAASAVLFIGGMALALMSSPGLTAMLLVYLFLTLSYSLYFKNLVLADVMVLGGLYTIRVIAGAIAVSVESSVWLLAFSAFIFFSLALVKRCAELKLMESTESAAASGRDYRVTDLSVLWPTGIAAGVGAVVIFALYISSEEIVAQFKAPALLWLICPCLGYWIGRMWIKTGRGEMDDDPLVYTATDRTSQIALGLIVSLFVAAWLIG